MSVLSEQYRRLAARSRLDADAAQLPNVRQSHLRSAERLDEMAKAVDGVAEAKARNDAAKLAESGGSELADIVPLR